MVKLTWLARPHAICYHFKTIEVFEQDTKKNNDNMHAKLRGKYLGIIILDNDEDDDDDDDELEDEVNE